MAVAVHLREWERLVPGKDAGAPLANIRLAGATEQALARRLAGQQMLHVRELAGGIEIEATSFVGKVRLGDVSITIAPKLRGKALIRLFCYAYELRDLLGDTTFAEDGDLFQDLLLAQFARTSSGARSKRSRVCWT